MEDKLKIIFNYFVDKCYTDRYYPGFVYNDKSYLIDAYWVNKLDNKFKVCIFVNGEWDYLDDYILIDYIINYVIK